VIPFEWLEQAQERIAPYVVETPLTHDEERGLYFKWENQQLTGSFKVRGALNKVLSLEGWERDAGLVAASAGNHGQGVALAGKITGSRVEVFVPEHAVPSKVEAIRQQGAGVTTVEGGYGEAESAAKRYAEAEHKTYISPYNDAQVIAGQGTLALEVLQQLSSIEANGADAASRIAAWIVPTGGGGLISACGVALANSGSRPQLIGVQAAASAFTHSLYHRKTQTGVEDYPTLADGLSGAIDENSVTIPMMRQMVTGMIAVSEPTIASAIAFAWSVYGERVEGSGAAGLAAVLDGQITARPGVLVMTGGNIEEEVFQTIAAAHAGRSWN
jgi:threonine dehydratase